MFGDFFGPKIGQQTELENDSDQIASGPTPNSLSLCASFSAFSSGVDTVGHFGCTSTASRVHDPDRCRDRNPPPILSPTAIWAHPPTNSRSACKLLGAVAGDVLGIRWIRQMYVVASTQKINLRLTRG